MRVKVHTWLSTLATLILFLRLSVSQQDTCYDVYPKSACWNYKSLNSCYRVSENCQQTCEYCRNSNTVKPSVPSSSIQRPRNNEGRISTDRNRCADNLPQNICLLYKSSNLCSAVMKQCNQTCGGCHNIAVHTKYSPGYWSQWGRFSKCSVTCGTGTMSRYRRCIGKYCNGSSKPLQVDSYECLLQKCPSDYNFLFAQGYGTWGSWGNASPCSKSCGGGYTNRSRECSKRNCVGSAMEITKCNTNQCTKKCSTKVSGRILGGIEEDIERLPWMVFVETSDTVCGGSIIHAQWVMTAKHCVLSDNVLVYAGIKYLWERSPQNRYAVSRVIRHTGSSDLVHDIALLKLSRPVGHSATSKPIRFTGYRFPTRTKCYSAGWGSTEYYGPNSDVLRKVDLRILDGSLCKQAYQHNPNVAHAFSSRQHEVICAGSETEQKDICNGDSGGPLMCKIGATWYIAGVASFGPQGQCAVKGSPSVFTRVNSYLSWIFKQFSSSTDDADCF